MNIFQASKKGREDVVRSLIEAGADVNHQDIFWNQTPLSYAAKWGHVEIVRLLIQAGANIDYTIPNTSESPLANAAERGHVEVVRLLIQAGVKINNHQGFWQMAPLHFAAKNGYIEIVRLLIRAGANINVKRFDITPLIYAAGEGHVEIVDLLLKSNRDNRIPEEIDSMMWAARNGHLKVLQLWRFGDLLDKVINRKDKDGRTMLTHATINGHVKCVRWLLEEKGADPNCGYDHLKHSITYDNPYCQRGPNLCLACERGYVSTVRILLQHGARGDLLYNKCDTMLLWLIKHLLV